MFDIGVQEVRRTVEKFSLEQNTLETIFCHLFYIPMDFLIFLFMKLVSVAASVPDFLRRSIGEP